MTSEAETEETTLDEEDKRKTPMVGVKLTEKTHQALTKLAALEKKTVTEVTRELIEEALERRANPGDELWPQMQILDERLSNRLSEIDREVGSLWRGYANMVMTAKRALGEAVAAQFYARLACKFGDDYIHFLQTNKGQDAAARAQHETSWQAEVEKLQKQAIEKLEQEFRDLDEVMQEQSDVTKA